MRNIVRAIIIVVVLAFAASAQAASLTWDRNAEADVQDYVIYGCFVPGCTVEKTQAMKVATVPQTAVGVAPVYSIDVTGKEGAFAVTARDAFPNESGLSVPVPFDRASPQIPAHPTLQ